MPVPVAALYVCFYAALGLLHPLFPVYLSEHGLSPAVATRALALGPAAAIIVPPVVGVVADALGARGAILRGALLLCTVALLAFLRIPTTAMALVAVTIAYSITRAPIAPFTDAAAYALAEQRDMSYGRLRLFGSAGFLLAVLAGGELVETQGWDTLLTATAIAYGLAFCAALLLPSLPVRSANRVAVPWRQLLGRRELWWFLAIVALSQVSAMAYDACYAMHLKQLGYTERFVCVAWGVAVFAEVIVLSVSGRLVKRFGAEPLLAFSFATMVAFTTAPAAIVGLQVLHGITYPLYWVPAVMLVHALAPRSLETAAQSLLSAAAGVGSVVGMWLSGDLFVSGGGTRVYVCASIVALATTVGALVMTRSRQVRLI